MVIDNKADEDGKSVTFGSEIKADKGVTIKAGEKLMLGGVGLDSVLTSSSDLTASDTALVTSGLVKKTIGDLDDLEVEFAQTETKNLVDAINKVNSKIGSVDSAGVTNLRSALGGTVDAEGWHTTIGKGGQVSYAEFSPTSVQGALTNLSTTIGTSDQLTSGTQNTISDQQTINQNIRALSNALEEAQRVSPSGYISNDDLHGGHGQNTVKVGDKATNITVGAVDTQNGNVTAGLEVDTSERKVDIVADDINLGTSVAVNDEAGIVTFGKDADKKVTISDGTITATELKLGNMENPVTGIDTGTAINSSNASASTLATTATVAATMASAMGSEFNQETGRWTAKIVANDNVTYGTINAETLSDAVSQVYSHIGSGEVLDKIEKRTEVVKNNGVSSENTVNENITAVNSTVGDISELNVELKNLTNGGYDTPKSVVEALNNIDATLGTIHGLNDKRGSNAKGNLAKGTTVEMHLSALDDAIGDRSTITNEKGSNGYEFSNENMYVADVLSDIASQIGQAKELENASFNGVSKNNTVNANIAAVNNAIGNVESLKETYFVSETSNLTDAVRVLDADMYKLSYAVDQNRSEINNLRRKMRSGMASLAAMSALTPNSRADGKTQLSIGTGSYESRPAVAIGAFHWITNNLMVNAGLSFSESDDAVYRMGLTYSF